MEQTQAFMITCSFCLNEDNIKMSKLSEISEMMYSGVCGQCSHQHFVCKICYDYSQDNNKAVRRTGGGRRLGHITSIKAARKHPNRSETHQKALEEYRTTEESSIFIDNHVTFNEENNGSQLCNDSSNKSNYSSNEANYSSNKSLGFDPLSKAPKFYEFEKDSPGKGTKYLVANAYHIPINDVSADEAKFCLSLATLLTQLTQQQQKLLAEIILDVANSKDPKLSIFKGIRVPTSTMDFDDIFLSGRNAIIPNLPHPVVKVTRDGTHAYVSLIDLLANELAMGTAFDRFRFEADLQIEGNTELTSISKTPAAYTLFSELHEDKNGGDYFILYLWLKEWRDAFDPNNTKSSRNQVWINTFTICPPESDRSGRNTYFMSMSGKADDHSEVDKILGNEIKKLAAEGHYFYHGGLRRIIKIKLGKIMTCIDRPERASMFQVGDHKGTYSTYWGYAGYVDGLCKENHLPSCSSCRKEMLRALDSASINNKDNVNAGCQSLECSGWDVLHQNFTFPAPEGYPTDFDSRFGAPIPPPGREIVCNTSLISPIEKTNQKRPKKKSRMFPPQRLKMVHMSIEWLQAALKFAHHNMKTNPPETRATKRFWTKANLVAYLRSCGISADLINSVYQSACNGDADPPFPMTWLDSKALDKCHYAGMHMLFLGHVKSNYEMTSMWLTAYEIKALFGKQANLYLNQVKKLRVNRYYSAHGLSTTKWGTGNWVSENYVFLARTSKFFFVLPAIRKSKLMLVNEDFKGEYKVVLRFVVAAQAAFSRLMSTNKYIHDMDMLIKIYMDTMVEFDNRILQKKLNSKSSMRNIFMDDNRNTAADLSMTENGVLLNDDEALDVSNENDKETGSNKRSNNKQPNFVKPNSLGILSTAESHNYFGPLILNWEGGFSGERKIQEVKPLLTIKRENADWQRIALRRLYQFETILKLLDKTLSFHGNECANKTRETEGLLKIYPNKLKAETEVQGCVPLSAVVDFEQRVWIAYRPNDGVSTRSALSLIEVQFDDNCGEEIESICWMSPIKLRNNNIKLMSSMLDVLKFTQEFALLLPALDDNGKQFINKYYAVGHKWSERNKDGLFVRCILNNDVFKDWL